MRESKHRKSTRLVEMVETHNISRSLDRLMNGYPGSERWRRALYHALSMVNLDRETMTKIREVLRLP